MDDLAVLIDDIGLESLQQQLGVDFSGLLNFKQEPVQLPQAERKSNGAYPVQNGAYPVRNRVYSVQNGVYPVQNGAYPVQHGSYQVQNGAYPKYYGAYPVQNGVYPFHHQASLGVAYPVQGYQLF